MIGRKDKGSVDGDQVRIRTGSVRRDPLPDDRPQRMRQAFPLSGTEDISGSGKDATLEQAKKRGHRGR